MRSTRYRKANWAPAIDKDTMCEWVQPWKGQITFLVQCKNLPSNDSLIFATIEGFCQREIMFFYVGKLLWHVTWHIGNCNQLSPAQVICTPTHLHCLSPSCGMVGYPLAGSNLSIKWHSLVWCVCIGEKEVPWGGAEGRSGGCWLGILSQIWISSRRGRLTLIGESLICLFVEVRDVGPFRIGARTGCFEPNLGFE